MKEACKEAGISNTKEAAEKAKNEAKKEWEMDRYI